MNTKIQAVKTRVRRHAPQVAALAGATVVGAALMSRHIDMNARFFSVDSVITAHLRDTGGPVVFQTPVHGTFVLAPVVPA